VRGIEFCRKLSSRYNLHIFSQLVGTDFEEQAAFRAKREKEREEEAALEAKVEVTQNMIALVRIMNACSQGNVEVVSSMIADQGNQIVSVADYDRRTPLHVASAAGQASVVKLLLETGADMHAEDRFGLTPRTDAQDDEALLDIFADFDKEGNA
jgi:hypothetical protein